MPRMVHRRKEKPGARGMSAPAMLGALIVSQEPDGAINRLLRSVYHILL